MNNKKKKFLALSAHSAAPATIFSKYIKNNFKIMPFKIKILDVGNVKYFPPVSRE
jgi:hypothetical protein